MSEKAALKAKMLALQAELSRLKESTSVKPGIVPGNNGSPRTAPAKVQIWANRRGQGSPVCILCIPPRNAVTILSLEVHRDVAQRVSIASKNPQAHPAKSELNSHEKVNKSVKSWESLWNAAKRL